MDAPFGSFGAAPSPAPAPAPGAGPATATATAAPPVAAPGPAGGGLEGVSGFGSVILGIAGSVASGRWLGVRLSGEGEGAASVLVRRRVESKSGDLTLMTRSTNRDNRFPMIN